MPTASPSPRAQIRAFTGARALPALLIVLYHYCEANGYRSVPWFDGLVNKGFLWVEFFFALSGFVLVLTYDARAHELFTRAGFGRFLAARLSRIYPVHLAMLLVLLAWEVGLRATGWPPNATRGGFTFVTNLLLIQAWNIHDNFSWNWPAWFVSTEFLLYLLFPLLLLLRRAWWLLIPAGASGLALLSATSGHGLDITYHNGIFRGASAFAVGAGFATLFAQARANKVKPLPEAAHTIAQLFTLAALLVAFYFGGAPKTANDTFAVLPILAFVFLLAFDRGLIARALWAKPLQIVGEWSFGIYMVHFTFLQMLQVAKQTVYAPSGEWGAIMWWGEPAIILALSLLGGWALTRFVERPGGELLRKRLTQWIEPPPS